MQNEGQARQERLARTRSAALAALLHGADSWMAWPRGVTLATSPVGKLMTTMAQHTHATSTTCTVHFKAKQKNTSVCIQTNVCSAAPLSSLPSVCSHVATCPPFHCVILTIVGTRSKLAQNCSSFSNDPIVFLRNCLWSNTNSESHGSPPDAEIDAEHARSKRCYKSAEPNGS